MKSNANREVFELVRVFGRQALFTPLKVDLETVPPGLYAYEISNDLRGQPLYACQSAAVLFGGTILKREALELSRKGTAGIRLGSWECSGKVCTLAEFISGASLGVSDSTAVLQPDISDIVRTFRQRILSNYDDFLYEWLHSEPEQLISYAEEIAATKHMRGTALSFTNANDIQYLMRFQNPLKVLRDNCPMLEAFDKYSVPDLMERIMADADAIRQYEPDEVYAKPEESQGQSM